MVLPGRIELPASPLPRECSTPELRQLNTASFCHTPTRLASVNSGEFYGLGQSRAKLVKNGLISAFLGMFHIASTSGNLV